MGCWNKTCGLTNLPIGDGERVVTFILVQNVSSYESHCYSSWGWEFIPMPIYGTYNDYGWMNFDEGQEHKLELLQEHFGYRLVRLKPYDEGLEDDGRSFIRYPKLKESPFENEEALGDNMHGSVFGVVDRLYKKTVAKISHVMIREDAFNSLKKVIYKSESPDTSDMPEEYVKMVIEKYLEFKNAKETSEPRTEDETEEQYEKRCRMEAALRRMNDYMGGPTSDFISEVLPGIREEHGMKVSYDWYAADTSILKSIFRSGSTGSEDGFETSAFRTTSKDKLTIDEMIDSYALACMFSHLRKSYSPQGGEGSQEGTNRFTDAFPIAYIEAAMNFNNRWGEEWPEEDERFDEINATETEFKQALENLKTSHAKLIKLRQDMY